MDDFEDFNGYFGIGLGTPNTIIDGSSNGSNFSTNNGSALMDSSINSYAAQGTFQGAYDDLNSFFTPGINGFGEGVVPSGNGNECPLMREGQWDNGEGLQMFDQQREFPCPIQVPQMSQQVPLDTGSMMGISMDKSQNPVTSIENQNTAPISEEQFGEVEKLRRGRPRKRKRKNPLSEEEKQRKREAFLERNRRAASKCRKRKKESAENIQAGVKILDKESRMLTAELIHLRGEHARWLDLVLQHANACSDCAIFQATVEAADNNLLVISGERFIKCDAFSRTTTIEMDQNSISDSLSRDTVSLSLPGMEIGSPSQYCNDQLQQTSLGAGDAVMMSLEHSQQSIISQRSGYSHRAAGDPFDRSRDHSNLELKQERQVLPKTQDERWIAGNNSQQNTSSQQSGYAASKSPEKSQLDTSIAMFRAHSNASNSSGTETGKSNHKDSGYDSASATTPLSSEKFESPCRKNMEDVQQKMPEPKAHLVGKLAQLPDQPATEL